MDSTQIWSKARQLAVSWSADRVAVDTGWIGMEKGVLCAHSILPADTTDQNTERVFTMCGSASIVQEQPVQVRQVLYHGTMAQ